MVIHEEVPCQESQIGISQHQQGAVPKGGRCPWPRAGVKEVARRCSRVSTRFRCFGCWSETCQPKPKRPIPTGGDTCQPKPTGGDTHALAAAYGTRHWQQPMARGTGSSTWHEGVRSGRVGVLAPRVHLLPQPARASTDVAARAQAQIDRHSARIDADGGEVAREVLREHLERAMGEPCSASGARVQRRWSLSRKPKEVGAVQVFAVQGAHCRRIFTLGRGWYCEVGHWAGGDHARVLEDGMHERALDRTRRVPVGRGRRRGEHLPA